MTATRPSPSPILKRVRIKSFKSIVDQNVDLGQLNIFIGQNGSGKSNFLEAIGMLSCATSGEIDYSRLAERGIRLSSPEIFRSAFKNKKRKLSFMLEGEFENFLYHANITCVQENHAKYPWRYHAEKMRRGKYLNEKIAGRSNRIVGIHGISNFDKDSLMPNHSIVSSVAALGKFTLYEQQAIKALKDYAIYTPSTPILRGVANDESHKTPLGLYGGNMAAAFSDLTGTRKHRDIFRFFELLDWFKSVGVRRPSRSLLSSHVQAGRRVVAFRDEFMSANFNRILAYDVSEGAMYVLFVLLLLAHQQSPNIFALDNVDNALNPSLVTSLVMHIHQIVEEHPEKQLFMTTHNPTTLDAIDLFNPKHRLFVVKRSKEGATIFEPIRPPKGMTRKGWQKRFKYMKLSEIWLSGIIEGLNPPKGF